MSSERPNRALYKGGEKAYESMTKVSAELFALTYGSLMTQILADQNCDIEATNQKLEQIGFSMGSRMVDEYFARSPDGTCKKFSQTGDMIACVACPMFFGLPATCTHITDAASPTYCLSLGDPFSAPHTLYQDLPDHLLGNRLPGAPADAPPPLSPSRLLAGMVRGALEMIFFRATVTVEKEGVWGDSEIRIRVRWPFPSISISPH